MAELWSVYSSKDHCIALIRADTWKYRVPALPLCGLCCVVRRPTKVHLMVLWRRKKLKPKNHSGSLINFRNYCATACYKVRLSCATWSAIARDKVKATSAVGKVQKWGTPCAEHTWSPWVATRLKITMVLSIEYHWKALLNSKRLIATRAIPEFQWNSSRA